MPDGLYGYIMKAKIMSRILFTTLLFFSSSALAYIGPGAGIPVLGSILGVISAIVIAIIAIIAWPIRRMLKKKRQQKVEPQTTDSNHQ